MVKMVEMIKKKFDKKTGEMLLICPRCGRYMMKLVKKGVIIDVCRHCGGMWADKGELEKLAKITKTEVKK
jgi:Zn-finger nucleic acid-binding protein